MVLWGLIPCSLVEIPKYQRNLINAFIFSVNPEDGGRTFLQNVGTYLPNCTASFGSPEDCNGLCENLKSHIL
jgi:hypothetical protein